MNNDRRQDRWMGIAWIAIAVALAGMLMLGAIALLGQRGGEPSSAVVQGFPTSGTRHVFQDGAITDTNGAALDVRYYPALGIQVQGITTATVEFECTIDRSNWNDIQLVNVETGAVVTSTSSDGVFAGLVGGLDQMRCPISGYSSGTITVTGSATTGGGRELADVDVAGTEDVTVSDITTGTIDVGVISNPLPAGANTIGDVTVSDITTGTIDVGEINNPLPAGTNNIGDVDVASNVAPAGKAGSTNYVHEPAVNTVAQIVLAAPGSGVSHVLGMVAWSYDGIPVAGSLTVEDDTGDLFKIDVDESGPGYFAWIPGVMAAANDAVTVTLTAGGAGISGVVNIHTWTQ